jgi:hypothetical protein
MAMKTVSEKVTVMAGRKVRSTVLAPEVPAIHALLFGEVLKTWMPGTRPGMTE